METNEKLGEDPRQKPWKKFKYAKKRTIKSRSKIQVIPSKTL